MGCGEAELKDPESLSWDHCVDDIAYVARKVSDGPVHFIGHCSGVKIIDDLVRQHRDVVASATWISPVNLMSDILKTVISRAVSEGRLARELLDDQQRQRLDGFLDSSEEQFGAEQAVDFLTFASMSRDWLELYWSDPASMQRFLANVDGDLLNAETFVRLSDDYYSRKSNQPPDYSDIPTLVLYSESDAVAVWDRHGAVTAQIVPDATIKEIPGGSHFLQFQKPAEASRVIRRFLADIS